MASISGANKIVLKAGYTDGGAEHEEGPLKVAAYPGQNVVRTSDNTTQERHTWTPGGTDHVGTGTGITTTKNPVRVLKEDALTGGTVTTQYSAGANCFVHVAKSGDVLQVLALSGENILKGVGLSANADGKWVVDATNAAVETLEDTNGALGEDTLVRVAVL